MKIMKLGQLLFLFTCFTILGNYKLLSANTAYAKATLDRDFVAFVENICTLLVHGYSLNEIVSIFDTNQENSIANIITDSADSKEAQEFYARKNFWAKIKNTYLAVRITVFFLVIIVICFFAHKYYKLFWKLIKKLLKWLSQFFKTQPSSGKGKGLNNNSQSQQKNPRSSQSQSNFTQAKQQEGLQQTPTNALPAASGEVIFQQKFTCSHTLYDKISQQIKEAESIGLEPTTIQIDDTVDPRTSFEYTRLSYELLDQQIKYAKSIGLVPK